VRKSRVPPFEAGLEHHRAGRLSEADAIYCALIAADPDHIDALHFSGDGSEELAAARWKILDRMSECADLPDSAALIQQLDLVITVDTAVAHLAGALGKPVWMLNCYESEWRRMLEREDSPWYPTMRLFRQFTPGDWEDPIARIATALRGSS
jgi:ADP-heptose:LPS heptosyltransferase